MTLLMTLRVADQLEALNQQEACHLVDNYVRNK